MSVKNLQFAVSMHIAATLAYRRGESLTSGELACSVNAEPSFVRRSIAKLAKAGLVATTRGKYGACALARTPEEITLLDIYRAAEAPPAASAHSYPVQPNCPVSSQIQPCMAGVLQDAQAEFEAGLARRSLAELVAAIRVREDAAQEAAPAAQKSPIKLPAEQPRLDAAFFYAVT
jgi:Rrf2 family protein